MNQAARIISIYAADTSGVCSALYEYGGMTVIHDASGCNSTYTTHDEPRWYDKKSMIFISGITEKDAVMGNDDKFIDDLVIAAKELKPAFIALCASPLPAMIGTDLDAIAYAVEDETGIPSFAVKTNGMQSYISGADNAFLALAKKFADCSDDELCQPTDNPFVFNMNAMNLMFGKSDTAAQTSADSESGLHPQEDTFTKIKVNLLGVTPLDFPKKESIDALSDYIKNSGFELNSCVGVNTDLNEFKKLRKADVNLLLSSTGKSLADYLYKEYEIPCVTGVPYGETLPKLIKDFLKLSFEKKINIPVPNLIRDNDCKASDDEIKRIIDIHKKPFDNNVNKPLTGKVAILGESILSTSLASALFLDSGIEATVIETVGEGDLSVLLSDDKRFEDENLLERDLKNYDTIIADPMFKPICMEKKFIPLPHEAFSGRCYTKEAPNIINCTLNLLN